MTDAEYINGFPKEQWIAWQLAFHGNPHDPESKPDPYYFLKYFVFTRDEAAAARGQNAYQQFPAEWLHIRMAIDFLLKRGLWSKPEYDGNVRLIPKARQMTITWLIMALFVWFAILRAGMRSSTIAQKKQKTYEHQERMWDIIRNLPGKMLSDPRTGRLGEYHAETPDGIFIFRYLKSDGQITIYHPDGYSESDIHAFTGTSSDARAYTLPLAYMEEVPWIPDALETYTALVQTVVSADGLLPIASTYDGIDELFYPLTIGDLEAKK